MKVRTIISFLLILITSACVDRFDYAIENTIKQGISISGFISDQPGPYEVKVFSTFDIESKESIRTAVTVKRMEISDHLGTTEVLSQIDEGIYQTSPAGIRGVVGGVYKLKVELFDGRIYESLPDTILAPGSLDRVYYGYSSAYNELGVKKYSFDLLFDASYDAKIGNQFIWKFTGTFQAETQPELYPDNGECFYLDELQKCNTVPPCSGYRNIGTNADRILEQRYPCTCCQCWYFIYNDILLLSDDTFTEKGLLKGVKAQNVPLNQWTLLHKIRIEVSQMSLTHNSFRFWKAIEDQRAAIGSLFQPVTGKIPSNFVQTNGNPAPIEGLFFATGISSKVQYVKQFELPPDMAYQISLEKPIFPNDCRVLFSNSTLKKPTYWID